MTDEILQRAEDAEQNRKSYSAIMTAATEHGVPFALALTIFFTCLTMAMGFMSVLVALVTYAFSHIIVKMFFSH